MKVFARFVLRWAGWVALLGTLLGGAGAYYSARLFMNLRTDLEELLPATARSVTDLNEVSQRLESIDNLAVLIFSKNAVASKRFVVDLAHRLNQVSKKTIASVEYKIDQELRFFKDRQALYMDLGDLVKIRDYIQNRIEYEKELYNPLNIFSSQDIPEPKLDFLTLKQKYELRVSAYDRFPDGFFATPDETKRVILVYMPGKSSGMDQALALRNEVEKAIAELKPATYSPDIEIRWTGGLEDTIEEHMSLIEDLELSTVIVIILVALAMFAFFRAIRATAALVFSVFIGAFWTFGLSYFIVGYLNANSAFLASIVIGNGINFGIIYLARYMEERRRHRGDLRATRTAMIHTAESTWTAALAAALSYGSLMLTDFRGFNQFGLIGLVGMVLCWVSAFTVLPAYLSVMDRWKPLLPPGSRPPKAYLAGLVARMIEKFPKLIWGTSFIATVVSLALFTRFDMNEIIQTDLSKLRSKWAVEHGSTYMSKYLDEIFQRYLSPIVLLPKSRENARKISVLLKKEKEREGPQSLIATVQTLDDFIPEHQEEKIRVLKEIKKLLPPRILQRLSPDDQKRATELLREPAFSPIREKDLPPLLLSKFTEKNKSIGKLVLVEPPLTHEIWNGFRLISLVHKLREIADTVEPGTAVAGMLPIEADMIYAVTRDGPKATFFAFLAVVLLVIFLFRNLRTVSLVLFALFLGVIWLAGVILGFGLKISFFNFIALPITFGIGIDYGVNIFQRYREEGGRNILRVIRNTGGAVGLCSFTTMVGYMSLLLAGNQGFVSFGSLAVTGELTCVVAAIISLPAYLILKDRKKATN